MLVSTMQAGESRILPGLHRMNDDRFDASFTVLCVSWFPSPNMPGALFHGAMGVTWDGIVAVLNPILLEFTQPLLSLPAPEKVA